MQDAIVVRLSSSDSANEPTRTGVGKVWIFRTLKVEIGFSRQRGRTYALAGNERKPEQ